MSRSQQRRTRLPLTYARGRKVCDITPEDFAALPRLLLSNPRLALGLFEEANIGFLNELGCWRRLRRSHPAECREIVSVAARMGIREKPESRPCATPNAWR